MKKRAPAEALERLYERYNRRELVHPDPLEFLKQCGVTAPNKDAQDRQDTNGETPSGCRGLSCGSCISLFPAVP